MREWELRVSEKEIQRIHVVRLTIEGRETVGRGAKLLGYSQEDEAVTAQAKGAWRARIVAWQSSQSGMEQDEIGHDQASDRTSAGSISGIKRHSFDREALMRKRSSVCHVLWYARFYAGPGSPAVRKRGVKRHYKRRERKAQEGTLLLWDGSPHHWFGEQHAPCNLTAVIDDATGTLLSGVFTRWTLARLPKQPSPSHQHLASNCARAPVAAVLNRRR